jgi:multidrug efflux system membrane fusion protein
VDLQKTLIRSGIAVVLIAGSIVGFRAYTSHKTEAKTTAATAASASADRVVPVITVPVAQRDMPIYLDGLGNVLPVATVTVHVQVDGKLERVAFREGQEVKRGDLLAQIDPRPFQAQLNSAQGAMARDKAQLGEAEKNLVRFQELAKQGLSSQQSVDDQAALVQQLKGTAALDQAAIETAQLSVEYTHVTSPIDGTTGIRLVDQGNLVHQADAGGLVVITTLDPIAIIFTLPQDNLTAIATELAAGQVAVKAMSRDGGSELASGKLALIDNQINQTTATIRLKAIFPNPKHVLWPNAFVKTRLLLSTRKNAMVIPAAVVQHGPQGTFAYVIEDNKAVVRPIVIDVTEGDQIIVASGLAVGEQVVLDGQNQLRPGSKVSATAPAPKEKKGGGTGSPGNPTTPAASGAPSAAPAPPASGTKQ